jgi:hypothetical protein
MLIAAVPAASQPLPQEPIGRFAADARGVFVPLPHDAAIAAGARVPAADLPTRGLGVVAGAHVYPFRLGPVTLGLGAEMLLARGSKVKKLVSAGADDAVDGPTANARFSALSPQLSLNFGSRDGWSYLSGGMGWSAFTAEPEDAPIPDPDARARTINYGGGARWFATTHLAVSLDLRFYAISPQAATAARPAYPRMRIVVLSGGVAFK